ncbi:hypothetical protein ACFL5P_00615 [candidate division KSB1 bacterium]
MNIDTTHLYNFNGVNKTGNIKPVNTDNAKKVKRPFSVPETDRLKTDKNVENFGNTGELNKVLSSDETKMFDELFFKSEDVRLKGPLKSYSVQRNHKSSTPSNKRVLGSHIDISG